MPEEFEIQKLKEQYPEFFEEISPEFLDFLFSEETSSKITEICFENGIEDEEKIEKVAYRISLILFGQVPKENFATILENGVPLNREVAERISIEVNRRIFSQAPPVLKEEAIPQPAPTSPPSIQEETSTPEIQPEETLEIQPEEKPKEIKKDVYREPIE